MANDGILVACYRYFSFYMYWFIDMVDMENKKGIKVILGLLALSLIVWPACTCVTYDGMVVTEPLDKVSSTLVVAASDSIDASRADYQCDGVADDVEIQAALNALAGVDGRVVLLEGNYTTTQNILIPEFATLEGQGFSSIMNANGAAVDQVLDVNGNGVVVKDLLINIVAGCGAAGARPNAIRCDSYNGTIVQSVGMVGDDSVAQEVISQQNGVFFDESFGGCVLGCAMSSWNRHGIFARDGGNLIISNNVVKDNVSHGMYISTCIDCLLEGNDCQYNDYGILLYSSSINNRVADNICRFNDHYGIVLVHDCSSNDIVDNESYGNDWSGIRLNDECSNNVIAGNVCNDSVSRYGIDLDDLSDENVISGNQCSSNDNDGIHIYECSLCTISENVCNNNDDGIYIEGTATNNADYNTVVANICYNNDDDGLELAGGTDCNYSVVDGNQLIGNSDDNYVDGGSQSEFWGGSTASYLELRPDLDHTRVTGTGKPTEVFRGIFSGFSLPIYAADNEELFLNMCVPDRWDGETDILVHVDCYIDTANVNKKFNLQLDWEHFTPVTDIVPATSNTVTDEIDTGAGAQYQSYRAEFTIDYDIDVGDAIVADDNIALRLIRIAATADEIAGEIVIEHVGVIFQRNKVGSLAP